MLVISKVQSLNSRQVPERDRDLSAHQCDAQTARMDLSTLQLFVEVVRQGSFAAVARHHDVEPSSVSRAIAALEKEIGIRLFQRTTRQVSPTESGAVYYERIVPLLEEMEQAISAATELSGNPQGSLRVTASVSFGLICILPLLPEFEATYPDLTVDLVLTDSVLDLVGERIDVAIRLGVMADSTLIAQRLMPTQYFVCASPQYLAQRGHPRHPQELALHECLRFPLAGFRSRWIFKDPQGGIDEVAVQGRTMISSAIALRDCAIAHMGVALLPDWLIQPDLGSGRLVNVFPDYAVTATHFDTAAWFVYPSRRYIPIKVKLFIDFLKQRLVTAS